MSLVLAAAAVCEPAPLTDLGTLLQVLVQFLSLSLFSLGGGNTLLAEYHHLAVAQFCWLSNAQFADLYALAEAAPGPSSMLVGLLGLGASWREGPFWALLTAYGALGILFAVGLKILRTADTNGPGVVVSLLVCLLMLRTRLSPLWFMAVAGVLGGLGVINR